MSKSTRIVLVDLRYNIEEAVKKFFPFYCLSFHRKKLLNSAGITFDTYCTSKFSLLRTPEVHSQVNVKKDESTIRVPLHRITKQYVNSHIPRGDTKSKMNRVISKERPDRKFVQAPWKRDPEKCGRSKGSIFVAYPAYRWPANNIVSMALLISLLLIAIVGGR